MNEDAAVLLFPPGKALVQTVDFFTPIVNDPYQFGRIAAANALSDIYAMGGEPYCAMNIVLFPLKREGGEVLSAILRGGLDALTEAGAMLVGGHSVEDEEIKYGLSVTGVVNADAFASNSGLRPGQKLVLTKPLGTGILATAVKAGWQGWEEMEAEICRWAGRLNAAGGRIIRTYRVGGATDVTGFGLGGHLLEMARASNVSIYLECMGVPMMKGAVELASMGLLPEGSHANRRFCHEAVSVGAGLDPWRTDVLFDAQTSGGLVLGLWPDQVEAARAELHTAGDLACVIGEVREREGAWLHLV